MVKRRAIWIVLIATAALAGCGGHATPATTGTTASAGTAAANAATAKPAAQHTVWLCFPGKPSDPCSGSLATTAISANGSTSVVHSKVAAHPAIDCFYVYPTVSDEDRGNADLSIQLPEIFAAEAQAEQFSQVCRVYAPMYRQITNRGLTTPSLHASAIEAYTSLLDAWHDYLAHDNHGRGVVLIGHSQGAYILKQLVKTEIDPNPKARRLLVSAILLGGQVLQGNTTASAGTFTHVPPCDSTAATSCVIAYSSFGTTPPAHARFGRDPSPASHVLCVNPAAPGTTATTPVDPLFPTLLLSFLGSGAASASTPWVSFPGLYTAACKRSGTASWLQITRIDTPGDTRPAVHPLFGAGWGLHATDVNIALANLVQVVGAEARAYAKRQ